VQGYQGSATDTPPGTPCWRCTQRLPGVRRTASETRGARACRRSQSRAGRAMARRRSGEQARPLRRRTLALQGRQAHHPPAASAPRFSSRPSSGRLARGPQPFRSFASNVGTPGAGTSRALGPVQQGGGAAAALAVSSTGQQQQQQQLQSSPAPWAGPVQLSTAPPHSDWQQEPSTSVGGASRWPSSQSSHSLQSQQGQTPRGSRVAAGGPH